MQTINTPDLLAEVFIAEGVFLNEDDATRIYSLIEAGIKQESQTIGFDSFVGAVSKGEALLNLEWAELFEEDKERIVDLMQMLNSRKESDQSIAA